MPRPGEWVFATPLGRPVQIIATRVLWGVTTIVATDRDGRVHEFSVEELGALHAAGRAFADSRLLTHVAAGARIAHHLNRSDTLTALYRFDLLPLPHQVQHLEDALARGTTRLLLADEVGLGKTITAGLILAELEQRGLASRFLVLTPAGLVPQWIQELRDHFSFDLTPLFTELIPTPETSRVWTMYDQVVTSYDAVKPIERRRGWTQERISAYNENRFDAMLEASWDVVVIDEAHRIAGASPGVARHALAAGLATVAPYLLLLTGTPHQGKVDHFHRLVQLLDPDTFSTPETISPHTLRKHLLRTEKRDAITLDGEPLFVKRTTELRVVPDAARSHLHRRLYAEVTEYIRTGYAAAEKETRSGLGFLMVLVQRLLASSTTALEETLQARLAFLRADRTLTEGFSEEEFADPDADLHEEAIRVASFGVDAEVGILELLITLIHDCQREGPDPKASYLLDLLRAAQQREADPSAKFLIFTEFRGTQRMLETFLMRHGYTVTILNGSMGLEERSAAQKVFRSQAQVLVSTEAGGEGLNLQFCHLVINYDLPWNPMRIEQRVGRVHRIGQQHPVFAYNMVTSRTVEHHVIEILGKKLEQIVRQLGIDKLSDVLDTPSVDSDIQRLYREALRLDERELEQEIEELAARIEAQAEQAHAEGSLHSPPPDLETIKRRLAAPVSFWLEQFSKNSSDGIAPDLRSKETRQALTHLSGWTPGIPVARVVVPDLPLTMQAGWSLWLVGLRDGNGRTTTQYHPLVVPGDAPGSGPVAQQVWEHLIRGSFRVEGVLEPHESSKVFRQCESLALEACRSVYDRMHTRHSAQCDDDERRHSDSVRARMTAIRAVGLPEVRQYRVNKLQNENKSWEAIHERRRHARPILEPVLVVAVKGGRG